MERLNQFVAALAAVFGQTLPGAAYTMLDDTRTAGSRKEQNLLERSADSSLFASNRLP
jgi:hypothetical protein